MALPRFVVSGGRVSKRTWERIRYRFIDRPKIHRHLQHLSGPLQLEIGPTDAVVIGLMRDSEEHIPSFLEHHFRLGVRHIVLLDNGSVDRTVELASAHPQVTLLQTSLPYKDYKYAFRQYLIDRFCQRGWCLILDIDERFDFPGSDQIALPQLLTYLNRHDYTAVVSHMLDMFPEGDPATWPKDGTEFARQSNWYNNTDLTQEPYTPFFGCTPSNEAINYHWGGLRKTIFGVHPNLTKHPLIYPAKGVTPVLYSSHFCANARIADVSTVLLHYKFDRKFHEKCLRAVERGNYAGGSTEYKAYLKALESGEARDLKRPGSRQLARIDQLVEEGFLEETRTYRQFVDQQAKATAAVTR